MKRATREKVVKGMLSCISVFGLSKTSLEDVARAAGVSRATLYRAFPGGRDELLKVTVESEVERLFRLLKKVSYEALDLEEAVVRVAATAYSELTRHEALSALLRVEPAEIVGRLTFSRLEEVLKQIADRGQEVFAPYLAGEQAARVAEWLGRVVISYALTPASSEPVDIEEIVRVFVLPGIRIVAGKKGHEANGISADRAVVGEKDIRGLEKEGERR